MNWFYLGLIGYVLGTMSIPGSGAGKRREQIGLLSALDVVRLITEAVKGSALFCISTLLFGLSEWPLTIAFAAYVLGRRLSVFHRFRGDPAIEAGGAFLISMMASAAVAGDFPWEYLALVLGVAGLVFVTRRWEVPALVVSLFIGTLYPLAGGKPAFIPALVFASLYLFLEALYSAIRSRLFSLGKSGEIKIWRILARPFALLFVLIDILANRQALLFVIGIVALIFIVTDFIRLATKKSVSAIFKKKEANRFSSMTLFLVSAFLAFLLFPATIPFVSLICITFGDFFSKIIGMRFGTIKLYRNRTLQGTLGFLSGSLMFNTIGSTIIAIPIVYIVVGSVIAAITELFSGSIDDNFSVSIVTGGVLAGLRFFLLV